MDFYQLRYINQGLKIPKYFAFGFYFSFLGDVSFAS